MAQVVEPEIESPLGRARDSGEKSPVDAHVGV